MGSLASAGGARSRRSFNGCYAPLDAVESPRPAEMKAQQQVAYESEESVRWTVDNVLANTANLTALDIDMIVRDSLAGNPLAKKAWPLYGMQEDVSESARKISTSKVSIGVRVVVGNEDVVEPMDRVQSKVVSFLRENVRGFYGRCEGREAPSAA
ncbi:Alpha/Beta hydrolase protein [Penicillium cinerascens]|uniref:Alpha/Beta hydrolase protein n=1 Tax=Penicillium cinerascens TaxID=70096 RepID=A0A9W9MDF5_9EURO|nr:Alpha/Beta hydrolase protein [Penicillium cinerascens]KAJ5197888.1 Alpha/Beta hydrolase protein [Penicillium cinerascens]